MRWGDNILRLLLLLEAFWIVACILLFVVNGNLIIHDEDGDTYSAIWIVGCQALIIFITLLVALIPNYFLFLSIWFLISLFISITLAAKLTTLLFFIIWIYISYVSMMAIEIYYPKSPYSLSLWKKIKYIPLLYKILNIKAKKEWIELFRGIFNNTEEDELLNIISDELKIYLRG